MAARGARVHDCGWVLDEASPKWPTICGLRRHVLKSPETSEPPGARGKQAFELNGGSGTHVDAPAHFVPGGRTIDALQPEELVGVPLAVIDAVDACMQDSDHAVTQAEIEADEARNGPILPGSLVCVRTGWSKRYLAAWDEMRQQAAATGAGTGAGAAVASGATPLIWTAYHGVGEVADVHPDYGLPRMHFPGLTPQAAAWLVTARGLVGLGVDTLSPDPGASEGFGVHHAVLGADRYIVENLNLEGLPARGARATVAPVAIRGAPEAPARIFAMVSDLAPPS